MRAARSAFFAAIGSAPPWILTSSALARRRACATPSVGQVPSVGRVRLPSRVRARTDQDAMPAAVRRSTSPGSRVSQISSRPVAGGSRPRSQASLISRRIPPSGAEAVGPLGVHRGSKSARCRYISVDPRIPGETSSWLDTAA